MLSLARKQPLRIKCQGLLGKRNAPTTDPLQTICHRQRRLRTLPALLPQQLKDERFEPWRQLWDQFSRWTGLLLELHPCERLGIITLERATSRGEPVQQDSQGIQVCLVVYGSSEHLFRRGIAKRAHKIAISRDALERVEKMGGSEIKELDPSVSQHLHIGTLEVPMDNSAIMNVLQRVAEEHTDAQHLAVALLAPRKAKMLHLPLKRNAFEQLHADPGVAIMHPVAVDPNNTGVIEARHSLKLPIEPRDTRLKMHQHLQRVALTRKDIECLIDDGHTALCERSNDVIRPDSVRYGL